MFPITLTWRVDSRQSQYLDFGNIVFSKLLLRSHLKPDATSGPGASAAAVPAPPCGDVALQVHAVSGSDLVRCTIVPPEGTSRSAVDVCAVVDVSGSMSSEATINTAH